MNCNLGNGKIEFVKDMNTLISNVSVESKENQISSFKSGLLLLISKYENAIEQFKESVEEYLEDENERYEISKHEDLSDELINSIDSIFNDIESELGSAEDKIGRTLSTDFTEKSLIRQLFLDKYFKYNSSSKLLFQKSFRNSAIRSIFIVEDSESKRLANSEEEINESILNFREKLLNDIIEVLKLKSNSAVINNFRRTWELDSNIAIKNYLDSIFNNDSIFPKSLIARLPEINSDSLNENSKTLLKGFLAYIALKHFDELMAQTFLKAISIKNFGEYNLNNSDKYSIKTADRVIHQWRDEDVDVDETEELGSLPMLFVLSLKVHDKTGRAKDETLEFSNVKVAIGHLMKILDTLPGSTFLGLSFPDAVFGPEITSVIEKEYGSLYNGEVRQNSRVASFNARYNRNSKLGTVNYLHWILDTYVKGKTFKQVLAAAKRYPEILMPIVFRLTQPVYNDSNVDMNSSYSGMFSKQGKTDETITSLYYEMYSPKSYSVFSMNTSDKGFDPDNNSIYQHVNTMFLNIENKLLLEYLKDEEKGIVTVNLGDKVGNTRLKLFLRALETKYDKLNPLSQTNNDGEELFLEFSIIDNLEREENNESPSGKSIIIKTKDGKQIVVDSDLTYEVFDENKKSFPITELNLRYFIPIFNEVLDLDFNEAFINILKSLGGNLKEVLGLVSKILYHFLVSKHMINVSSNQYDKVVGRYYTINNNNKNLPTVAYTNIQPKIISSFDTKTIMTKLSKVRDILEGYSEINTVQDGERKLVSTLGLSTLLSKYNEIIENYGKNPDSPIKHFSIYGMYEGAELMRDYAEPGNNKQAKKFTEEELVTASFLYDMYGDLKELDDEDNLVEKNGGILRVMGPVVSDKGNLIKLKYNWDSPVKEKYNTLLRPDDPNAKLRLRDLTAGDLKVIIKEEFGEYYQNVLNYVQQQFGVLNKSAIIWAHHGIGKSWSVLNGKYKDQIIDWDVEFNSKRDAWIAEKSNTNIGSKKFEKAKKQYLTDSIKNPGKYLDFIAFYTQEWNRVKNKARSEGKILVASPHILLKLFPQDFDKIITMDDETFIQRNMERGGTEEDSISLKQDLNATLSQLQELDKIITDNRYLEEILEEGSLRTSYIDMAIDSLGLNYPKGYGFDYLSSFAKFNEIFGKDALKVLREAIYLAQQAGEEIEIIDLVHYIVGENGELQNNPSLIHQLQIFGKLEGGEQYEDFWKRKEDLLFIDFLQTETELQVKEGVNAKKGVAIQTAIQQNQGWIKGENIAVAKVSEIVLKKEEEETKEDSRSLLIATKDDFKNWYPYKSLINWYGKNLPSELNIDSPDANLLAIMKAVDLYSVVRKLSEKETLDKIIKSKPDKWKSNIKGEYLLLRAFNLYSETRRKYNRDIPDEKLQEDFNKKVEKEFTKDGKLDKKVLVEYINKKETINDIEALMDPELLGPDGDNSYLNPFVENIEKPQYTIELNPEFIKHNLYDFLLGEEFVLSTTGTYISLPGKSSNIIEREAEQFGNAVKRYVAYTASKHREEANALNGITEDINLAIIEDDKDFSFNFVGESGTDKPFDGASFYNILMNYLDNNSLGGDAMGVDKKPFAHFQGIKSGIGFILKTAGFSHTNDRIRNSKFDARLNKLMNDIKWDSPKVQKLINPNWKPGDEKFIPDWTKDYFRNNINYGEWFAYRQNLNGTWSWYKHRVNNGKVEMIRVLSNGEILNGLNWIQYGKSINSNYDLWEAFGGAYSGHLLKNSDGSETLVYEHDESSVLRLLKAVNNVGIRKTINGKPIEKVFDLTGVNQYLKKACIHIVATGGAVKYGGANINPKEAYYDDDYHLTHMIIKSYDLGEQLDAEHSAEDGHVSLMTLVINALGARGYTSREAMQCYVALANVAEYITGDILKAMETDDPELIDKVMEKSIYKTLLLASDNDGDMLNALAASLLNGKNPSSKNISEIAKDFPISHPAVFNKVLSSLASQLEKGIKLKFEGGMFVLNPSNRRMTVINGHLSGYYDTRRKIYNGEDAYGEDKYIDELMDLENESLDHPITSVADIKLGYNYRDSDTDELFIINTPKDIYAIKELMMEGHSFYETFIDDDGQPLGRDLTTYLLAFSDVNGIKYNSWELDSVRMLLYLQTDKKGNEIGFKIPSRETEGDKISFQTKLQANWDTLSDLLKAFNIFKNKQLYRQGIVDYNLLSLLRVDQLEEVLHLSLPEEVQLFGVKNFLIRRFLEELNAISSGIETEVQIDGKKVKVDKTKVDVTSFGIILPPIYKTQFGLKELDTLSDIEKDQTFFIKRQLQNWKTKIANLNTYDLELKTLSGEHIYLAKLTKDFIPSIRTLQEVQLEFPTNFELDGEILYRITPLGKRLYSVPYSVDETGNIIPDIRVFKDKATGTEVIYSKNLTHFLDEFNYSGIVFSLRFPFNRNDFESEEEYKETLYAYKREILKQLNSSTNKTAIRKINTLSKLGSDIVNNNISDELKNDSYDIHFLASIAPDKLINLMNGDLDFIKKNIELLEDDLEHPELTIEDLLSRNKFFTGLINSGIDIHTSFLESLEFVVSRTPALSLLSFMSMKIEAFGPEDTNSAYVSRDLLWLQGSDYDIDKISLLGLKFNHGKLTTWSPFFSLKNRRAFIASKKLPFPTNKELSMLPINENSKIPYDVLRNDLTVVLPEDSESGAMIITTLQGTKLSIKLVLNPFKGEDSVEITAEGWETATKLEQYILMRRVREALSDFKGLIYLTNFNIPYTSRLATGLKENNSSLGGYLFGDIDKELDFEEFNQAILGDYIKYNGVKLILENIIEYAPNLGLLIQAYNDLGYIPESLNNTFVKILVDVHNTSIKNKSLMDALYNFISIKVKDISADPANRIQGQSPIDPEMDKVKNLINDSETYPENQKLAGFIKKFDRGSMYSKIKMLTLTLGGKEGVGIEASSLKNFELSSQYNYNTLDKGTVEDLEDLLFSIKINGKTYEILANSRARNIDTVKSRKVREVLKKVNLYQDTFLTKSGLLSLSTDNAKDPKLPLLNCGPKMMSLYDAGVMLGISVNELASLILTDTGILINKLSQSNIFTGKQEQGRVIDVIRYLLRAPQIELNDYQLSVLTPLFLKLGLLKVVKINPVTKEKEYENLTKTKLGSILLNKSLREQLKEVFRFLLNPSEDYSLLEFKKDRVVNNILSSLYGSKDYRGFSPRAENYFNELEKLVERTEAQEKTYLELLEKKNKKAQILEEIKLWEDYKNGILPRASIKVGEKEVGQQIDELENTLNNYTKDDFKDELKRIKGNIFSGRHYLGAIKDIYKWLTYLDIIEETVTDEGGQKHRVLWQLLKLAEIAEELSVLRPLMKLNLGLENKIEDLIKFYTDFSRIITNRIEILGKEKALKRENVSELLSRLKQINDDLRTSGSIHSKEEYYVDLHTFLYNPEYNKLVKDIYGKIKCTTNIFKVVDSIPNYRKYLRLADSSVTISGRKSRHFRTLKYIEDTVIPEMGTRRSKWLELMRKNTTSYINRQKNKEFLLSQNVKLSIPSFKIENGKLVYLPGKPETILLGLNKENDLKFKQYVEFILFPDLKRKYPNNKFLSYLGYRVFDFNDDHNSSINLSKIKTNDMNNPSDLALFNLAKLDMLEISKEDIKKLFYYNLIAYNNQSGQSSLTIMFDDIIRNNSIDAVVNYNKFITDWDKQPLDTLISIGIMKAIAPVLKLYEVNSRIGLRYFYVQNPEDKKTYLCYRLPKQNRVSEEEEDPNGFNQGSPDGENTKTFRGKINDAGYAVFGLPKYETKGKEVQMLEFGKKHRYRISKVTNFDDIQILVDDDWKSIEEILEIAKSKGFSVDKNGDLIKVDKSEKGITPTKLFNGKAKDIENNLKLILYRLDTILDDDPNGCKR